MIRRSAVIATSAILLSLLVHFVGLDITFHNSPERVSEEAETNSVALGNAFEDVAETPPEPVLPEPAVVPEPPAEPVPAPESAETPTSRALVASDDPKATASPDTGSAAAVQPDLIEPTEPVESDTTEPETAQPSGVDDDAPVEMAVSAAVEPAATPDTSAGTPEASAEPVEAGSAETLPTPPVAPAPTPGASQQIAALPPATVPTLPVTLAPDPSAVPVVPTEREALDPTLPEQIVEPTPETSETTASEDDLGGSDLAVAASLRPKAPTRRPSGNLTAQGGSSLPPAGTLESPLETYRRTGSLDGRPSRNAGRGPGNSDVTNYAGRVLVHLNRIPSARVRIPGTARVIFEVNRDGTLAWVDVTDSTGTLEFDSAARAQVRKAAPFPRPPQGANRRFSFVFRNN